MNEVYIDGCNVAECEWAIDGQDVIGCKSFICCCEEITNCHFKQLKRLEAENEKLKCRIEDLEKCEDIFFQENEDNKKYIQALEEISEIAYTTDFDIVDIQEIVDEVLK